ncbi:MAG: isoprenylcysteine carboxylmethyltransferase family protein [Chitinophagaceae bacterium]|nr:MAG: isoprenylcysteine carboxylmethyltransferase family protein [Chitinophagaceae bacterium]
MKNSGLFIKSMAGILFLLTVIGAISCLCYGSLDYPLAWLYLATFFIPVFAITVYLFLFNKPLLTSRLYAGPVAEQRWRQKLIQSAAGLIFIAIYAILALDYRDKWSEVPLWLSYSGDAFCVLAFIFLFFVYKQNTFLSATIEVQENQQVISNGLYGVIRHPMYSGALILMFFTPLALGSLWGLIPVAVLLMVIIFRIIDEEKVLKRHLEGYEAYCKKVKYRLLPLIF